MFKAKEYLKVGFLCLTAISLLWGKPVHAEEQTVFEEESYTLTIETPLAEDGLDVTYSEFNPETDWNPSYEAAGHYSYFTKGESGYYMRLDEYVYFCSFETGQLVPLCSRPDCLHDKETDAEKKKDCYAYVPRGTLYSNIQYYEGKLYLNSGVDEIELSADNSAVLSIFQGDYIYVLSTDGSSREILNFSLEWPSTILLHRGYVYYACHFSNVDNGTETYSLRRIPLGGGKEEIIANLDSLADSVLPNIYPYGNYVYMEIVYMFEPTRDTNETVEYRMIYDIENDRIQVEEVPRGMTGFYYPQGDKILCMSDSEILYQMDLDGRNFEPFLTLSVSNPEKFGWEENPKGALFVSMDESYLYRMRWDEAYQPYLMIYDRESGELLQCIPTGEGQHGMLQRVGIEDGFVFFGGDVAGRHTVYWIEKDKMLEDGAQFHQFEP